VLLIFLDFNVPYMAFNYIQVLEKGNINFIEGGQWHSHKLALVMEEAVIQAGSRPIS
jgi:hypothetical protein